jgi:sterol desaturase/sphingolipid hydroxylase (fatty acid hydroxylase superfamily)
MTFAKAGPAGGGPTSRLRRAALPTVTVASGVMAMSSVPLARRLRRHVPAPLADLVVNSVVFGAVGGLLAVAERIAPFREDWNEPDGELAVDLGYLLAVLPATALVSRGLVDVLAGRLPGYDPEQGRRAWPSRQPLVVRVLLALLISELVHYWHHRLSHEHHALWLTHAAHHSETRLWWASATRLHPADEVPLMVLQVAALSACGVDRDAMLVHNTMKSFMGLIEHANVDGPTGRLNLLFGTAEQHRAHHALAPGGGTVNYGSVLSVWDRVFGTFDPRTGDRFDGDVGLRNMPEYPRTLRGQMAAPFVQARPAVVWWRRRLSRKVPALT